MNDVLGTLPTAADAPFNTYKRQHDLTCLPDTRVDLLREIYDWADGESSSTIFWLSGLAGTGKSTLARTVAAKYSQSGQLAGSFFFSRGGGDVGHAGKFITSVAFQLANNIPALKRNICVAISEHSDIANQSLSDQWRHLVLNPLSDLDSSKDGRPQYVLVVDALDECEDQNNIQIILQLLAEAPFRVFLTSRPEVPIRYGFNEIREDEHQDFVLHDIEKSIVDHDISLFLRYELGLIRRKFRLGDGWPNEKAITTLVQSAGGLFIWAATACRFIEQGGQLADSRLSLLLHVGNRALPLQRKLDEIYTTVLDTSVQGKYDEEESSALRVLFRQVVGPIVTSLNPLSVPGLAELLQKDVETVKRILDNLHSVLDVPETELGTIQLLHPSFRDFLLDPRRCSDPQFYIDEKLVHHEMYKNCLRVMSEHLRRDICNLRRPGAGISELSRSEVDQQIYPYVQYACRFWVDHYERSDITPSDYYNIGVFLQKHFLHWLEALALLGLVSDAVLMVHMLSSTFSVRNSHEK